MKNTFALFTGLIIALWLPAAGAQLSLAEHAAKILAAEDAAAAQVAADPAAPVTDTQAAADPAFASGLASEPATVPAAPPAATSTEMRFVSLARLTFVHDKWALTEQSQRGLDAAALYLAQHPGASRLLIRGHTDEVGSIRFNDGLSDKRAMAVRDYLASKGVPAEQMHWEGHGEHAPTDENWTRLGRARNRQVEIFAIYPPPLSASARY